MSSIRKKDILFSIGLFLCTLLGIGVVVGLASAPNYFNASVNQKSLLWTFSCLSALSLLWLGIRTLSRYIDGRVIERLSPFLRRAEGIATLSGNGWRSHIASVDRFYEALNKIEIKLEDAERAQSKANTEARKAAYLQERFLRTISDDVRKPVLQIMTGVKALSNATNDPAEITKLDLLYANAFQLLGSINDALELGRPAEPTASAMRAVSLVQLTQDLSELYAQPVGKKPEVMVSFLVDKELPHSIIADPKKLLHLMGNFIENALRFTEKGIIEVVLSSSSSVIEVGTPCTIVIACKDTGAGIDSTKLIMMTKELRDNLNDRDVSELGLGLRAANKIVQNAGGLIKIESEVGKGTVITASFLAEVAVGPRNWNNLPSGLRFFSNSNEVFVTIGNIAYFHNLRPIPITNPAFDTSPDTIFIDVRDLVSGEMGKLQDFKPPEKYVVIMRHSELQLRERLLLFGFTRFLLLPLTSTSLLQCLLGEDSTVPTRRTSRSTKAEQKLKILIVDDVETTRLRISEHLKGLDHEVTEATDGLELVELVVGGNQYDVIFSDLTMTHLDGVSAVKQVREYEKQKGLNTPIIAMTAYSLVDESKDLLKVGFNSVLKKPVYLDELDFILSKITPQKRSDNKNVETEVESVMVSTMEPEKTIAAIPVPEVATQFIDLDDLRKRTSGKVKIMAQVLESFILTSRSRLSELKRSNTPEDTVHLARTLHTLKGLLLEAGAIDCAKKIANYEENLNQSLDLTEQDLLSISGMIEKVCGEAAIVKGMLV